MEEYIEEFIEWAKNCGEDAWYIFENTEEAIERWKKEREEDEDNFLGDAGS